MKTCIDCLYCKIIIAKQVLRCSLRHWSKFDGSEKLVKLGRHETIIVKPTYRELFAGAERCVNFNFMDRLMK